MGITESSEQNEQVFCMGEAGRGILQLVFLQVSGEHLSADLSTHR